MDLKTLQTLQTEIEQILAMLDIDFVEPQVELGEDEILKIELQSNDDDTEDQNNLGILIGSRGETLSSIEYVLSLVVNRDRDEWLRLQLDVDGYRAKRMQELVELAEDMAEKAMHKNEPVTLHPMPNYERRVVHTALSDRPDVETESTGEGRGRRIVIIPL